MGRFCTSALVFIGCFSLICAVELHCYNNSDTTKYQTVTLESPEDLILDNCIDISLPTYIYTHGVNGKENGPGSQDTINTILKEGSQNFIFLNWENEASTGSSDIEISLSYALKVIPNAISIGIRFAHALVTLVKYGLNLLKVNLVGHSMGAHLMGYTGRTLKKYQLFVKYITGLDPALPLYSSDLTPLMPLDETCAKFVTCIHTDPGNYGLNKTCGSKDVWVNYAYFLNGIDLQPGCPAGDFAMFSTNDICSHNRSWKIQNQAILNNELFIAIKAANYSDWVSQNGKSNETFPLGSYKYIDSAAPGFYYMSTTGVDPFGKGKDGLKP